MSADIMPKEPSPRPFLTAQWRWLAMLNYEVDPDLLGPYLPKGLEIDSFEDRTFVSVVGFRFLKTSILGCGVPCHRDFDEVNLRFYVKREMEGETRRGVVFIREMVPKRMVAWVANWIYHENYRTVSMRSEVQPPQPETSGRVSYAWDGGSPCRLTATFAGSPTPLTPGTLPEFILEHYWGYTLRRDGTTAEYQVEHPSWNVWIPETAAMEGNVEPYYGAAFAQALRGPCHSAVVADGSDILVRRGRILSDCPVSVGVRGQAPG
ncbi:MAG: DUF2071 domain-containing protein [Gemmataceae bacterium]|nr:DUF2071 domain-containing protein [Gemmataceae bacterium]